MWKQLALEGRSLGGESLALCSKLYGLEGREYPRIAINIYDQRRTYKISIQRKEEKGWWEDTDLPKELLPDLLEMLSGIKPCGHSSIG